MILIDPPAVPRWGRLWSHLASDLSYEEVHVFAATHGVPPRGWDGDHYDIPGEAYDTMLACGATAVTSRELVVALRLAGLRNPRSIRRRSQWPG